MSVEILFRHPPDLVAVLLLDPRRLLAVVDVETGEGKRDGEEGAHLGTGNGGTPVKDELGDAEVDKAVLRITVRITRQVLREEESELRVCRFDNLWREGAR